MSVLLVKRAAVLVCLACAAVNALMHSALLAAAVLAIFMAASWFALGEADR